VSPTSAPPLIARLGHEADRARRGAMLALRSFDPRIRALPDFVVIGAQKSGTSSLYARLSSHPSVVPALRKELHFFDRAPAPLRRYRSFFPHQGALDRAAARTGRGVTGEATPFYLFHPAVPARIHAVVPAARLVVLLREPVSRAISSYHHAVRRGFESRPIEAALDPAAAEVLPPATDVGWYDDVASPARRRGYLARGRYAEQLERWFAQFPREQFLVLESGAMRVAGVPPDVCAFLGLAVHESAATLDRNIGAYAPPPAHLVATLREYYRPHNARLFELLDTDFGWPA
jgi:hypothetical protein